MIIREMKTIYTKEKIKADRINGKIQTPQDVYDVFNYLENETKEHFIAIFLSTKHKILGYEIVSIGSLNGAIAHPREIFKTAILANCCDMILVHNHPSTDPTPSPQDILLTERLKKAGDIIGIGLVDHIIIGRGNYRSLKEQGIL